MRSTIKRHIDFAMADDNPTVKTPIFITRARPTIFPDDARYGLIVTKRTFKLATERNRAKRLLRAWISENEKFLDPTLDYVFIARRPILDTTKPDGVLTMKNALLSLGKK